MRAKVRSFLLYPPSVLAMQAAIGNYGAGNLRWATVAFVSSIVMLTTTMWAHWDENRRRKPTDAESTGDGVDLPR